MLIYSLILCTNFKTSGLKLFSFSFLSMALCVSLVVAIFYRDTFKTHSEIIAKFKETFDTFNFGNKETYEKLQEYASNEIGIFQYLHFGKDRQNIKTLTTEDLEQYCNKQKEILENAQKDVQNIFIADNDKQTNNKRKRKNQMLDLLQKLIELFDGLKYIQILLLGSQENKTETSTTSTQPLSPKDNVLNFANNFLQQNSSENSILPLLSTEK